MCNLLSLIKSIKNKLPDFLLTDLSKIKISTIDIMKNLKKGLVKYLQKIEKRCNNTTNHQPQCTYSCKYRYNKCLLSLYRESDWICFEK